MLRAIGVKATGDIPIIPWLPQSHIRGTIPDLFTKQGALFNADKIHTPLLLFHGTEDTNVPIGESIQLFNALKASEGMWSSSR